MAYEIHIPANIEGCVYKLWYANRYVIVKCKTIVRSVQNIKSGLDYFFKGTPKGRKDDDFFHEFFTHVQLHPFENFEIEMIFASNNPYELLKTEQAELFKAKYDPQCLNQSFDAYIPKFTQVNGKKSWINRGYYLNFMIWKKKRLNQSKPV